MADTNRDAETLKDDKEAFDLAQDAESHNREAYEEDIRFARLEDQWSAEAKALRGDDVPTLTLSELGAYIRQVVNDARQNKPAIKVLPVDDQADPETAKVFSGLIRNIESSSSADMAYDWGVDCAASGGFGYWRIIDDYAHDDSFEKDLRIKRVLDPLSVYGDPHATEADGSDWMSAFVVERMRKEEFSRRWKGAQAINWDAEGYSDALGEWFQEEEVLVAEHWIREEVDRPICLLSNGNVISKEDLAKETEGVAYGAYLASQGIVIARERVAKSWRVKQRLMTGVEVLDEVDWPGRYIPIVPIYGEEVYLDSKRYFRSLIRSAKDGQKQKNFWESTATELTMQQPRIPFIGAKGAFKSDRQKWNTANKRRWPFIEYDGDRPPVRQPIDMGPAVAALSEATRASENIKRSLGMYGDAVRQTASPESGRALNARHREQATGTFHFSDNQMRAVRHTGRILIDLAPHYYNTKRIIRVLGEDGTPDMVPLKTPIPARGPEGQPQFRMGADGQPMLGPTGAPIEVTRMHDLTLGKYDLVVRSGPNFTTRREEAATQMTEMVRAMPDTAPLIMDLIAKNLDWPGADEIAERFKAMVPDKAKGGIPPEIQKAIQQAQETVKKLAAENQQLKGDRSIDAVKVRIDAYKAETERKKAAWDARMDIVQTNIDLSGLNDMNDMESAQMQMGSMQ